LLRFETAALHGKRLLIVTDSERYGGEVSTLKAITGQDPIRCERKNVQQNGGFEFPGMVLVMANEAIQSSDYTSGLKRRRLTIPFLNQVAEHQQRDLESEFEPYLAGVLEWALQLPDHEMYRLLKDTKNSVQSLKSFNDEFLLDTNPLAEWLDNCVVLMPTAKTYVGTLEKSADLYLYPSYSKWMQTTGSKALSLRRFSENLLDLCSNQLKLPGITKGRDNQGSYIKGIAIRGYGMLDLPRPITSDGLSDDLKSGLNDESVTSQTLTSDGTDESDVSDQLVQVSEKDGVLGVETVLVCDQVQSVQTVQPVEPTPTENHMGVNETTDPSHPSLLSLVSILAITELVVEAGQSITQPVTSTNSVTNDPEIESNVQLIKDAILEMDGGIVEILAEGWSDDFKQAVLERLSVSEKKAVYVLAPQTFPSLAAKPEVTESSPSFVVGDVVEILNDPKLKGKSANVSTITKTGIWVRVKGALAPLGEFQPHQLRKC